MSRVALVVVTGLAGAGKTIALHAFEDLGYFCVDNLPPPLLPKFVELSAQSDTELQRLCVGLHIRDQQFSEQMLPVLDELEAAGQKPEILFLEASDEVLVRRFRETRRQHPLAPGGRPQEGIEKERARLAPLHERADRVLDTSAMTPHDLRQWVLSHYGAEGKGKMSVSVLSFGFRRGVPQEADLVFDVRFLPNPNFEPELKPLDGREQRVYDYVLRSEGTGAFLERLEPLLAHLLPAYAAEGKANLTIAFGCTGGQHRSVALARWLGAWLTERGYAPSVIHRDLPAN